jgi:hypothetical protein
MDIREIFIRAVQSAQDIPEAVRLRAHEVGEVREAVLTQSYLDFLDRDSWESTRGPAFAERMKQRLAHMSSYRDARTVGGSILCGSLEYDITIDVATQAVIHCETWRYAKAG